MWPGESATCPHLSDTAIPEVRPLAATPHAFLCVQFYIGSLVPRGLDASMVTTSRHVPDPVLSVIPDDPVLANMTGFHQPWRLLGLQAMRHTGVWRVGISRWLVCRRVFHPLALGSWKYTSHRGTIGTGISLSAGSVGVMHSSPFQFRNIPQAIALTGPGSALLACCVVGFFVYTVVITL